MRLAAYTDYKYRFDGRRFYGERAFVRFLCGLADHVESLTLVGRLEPGRQAGIYPLDERITVVGLPYYKSLAEPLRVASSLFGAVVRFWRVLSGVDTVWLLGPYPHAILFALVALVRGRRVVLGVRQDLPTYTRVRHPEARWMHLGADVLERLFRLFARAVPTVVVGPALAERYRRASRLLELTVSLVDGEDVAVGGRRLKEELVWPPYRLLSVGRLDREKAPLLLVDLLAALRSNAEPWTLDVVGDGPLRGALEERVEQAGLRDCFRIHGYVPYGTALRERYREADMLVVLSLTEGLPQVVFEAFAAGIPVVASDVGGIAQAVGRAVLLVAPGDVSATVDAIRRLASDRHFYRDLALRGHRYAQEHTVDTELRRLTSFLAGS